MAQDSSESNPTRDTGDHALRQIGTVALLSVLLGFVMQGFILAVKLAAGGAPPGIIFISDLAQGITWSFFVCTGVSVGVFLSKARASVAGFIALACAPFAVALAKSAQKTMNGILKVADQPAMLSLATISILRAIEYGILGWLLAKLAQRETLKIGPYIGSSVLIGVIFGGTISFLTYSSSVTMGSALSLPKTFGTVLNEMGSPIGCALLIYIGQWIAHRQKLITMIHGRVS